VDVANRPLYEQFGALVRRRRRALELTQDELSGRLGISRGALANIETGRQNILLHQIYRFAAALEMGVHELLPIVQESKVDVLPLPKGLTSTQQNQIARLLSDPEPLPTAKKANK
jgi:transcriptional regulator with XRE-family HTH domain